MNTERRTAATHRAPTLPDAATCYRALSARDNRFDGLFFVGVRSTGIYCRAVCSAKTPKPENCVFFAHPAAAERVGFRPCLRCRPELAPGMPLAANVADWRAGEIVRCIEEGSDNLEAIAEQAGMTTRHLRRVVQTVFGVSPVQLAQSRRLLLAKELLTDTDLPITQIAFASGWQSLRRFNAAFRAHYRLTPTDLRKTRAAHNPAADRNAVPDCLSCTLSYRAPFDFAALLDFLGSRAVSGCELVENGKYLRTVAYQPCVEGALCVTGWLGVEAGQGTTLRVEVSASLVPVLRRVLARVRRLFDLSADPNTINAVLLASAEASPALWRSVNTRPGLRVPGAFDGFEAAVRAILGQQISVRAASTLAGRLAQSLGEPVETPWCYLTRLFPTPQTLTQTKIEALTALGITQTRAETIRMLAQYITEKRVRLEPGGDVETTIAQLQTIPSIGNWTAQYIAMRALSYPDAFLPTDLGLRKALNENNPRAIEQLAQNWRPWRSYAVMHLWAEGTSQNETESQP